MKYRDGRSVTHGRESSGLLSRLCSSVLLRGPHRGLFFILLLPSLAFAQGSKLTYERMEGESKITGHGTAFGVGKRLMLTAAHNVADGHDIFVSGFRCKVLKVDGKYDLALLEAPVDVVVHEMGEDAKVGDKIVLSGSKRGEAITESKGQITELNHEGSCRDCMKVDFDHGCSGSPVMKDGRVVGIAVAGVPLNGDLDHTVGLFIRASIIKEFLK